MASVSSDHTVRLWDSEGNLLHTLTGHKDNIWEVAFSPDGQVIASASNDKTVKLWNLQGELLHTLEDHEGFITQVKFNPKG